MPAFRPRPSSLILRPEHPLARSLAFYTAPGGGQSADVVSGTRGQLVSTTTSRWTGVTDSGPGLQSTSTSSGGAYWPFPASLRDLRTSYTISVLARVDGSMGFSKFLAIPYRNDASWNSPFVALAFTADTSSTLTLEGTTSAGVRVAASGSCPLIPGDTRLYTVVRSGTSVTFYRDAIQMATATLSSNFELFYDGLGAGNAAPVHVFQRNFLNTSEGFSGVCLMAGIWSRALSAGEVSSLVSDPFGPVRPVRSVAAWAAGRIPPPPPPGTPGRRPKRWYPGLRV